MKVNEIITQKIIDSLEKGKIPWKSPFRKRIIAQNGITRRRYTGINFLLLNLATDYDLNLYYTFNQIKQLGGSIKKDSKSDIALFYTTYEAVNKDTGTLEDRFCNKFYHIFNIEKTTLEIPEDIEKPEQNYINGLSELKQFLKQIIKKYNIKLKFDQKSEGFFHQKDESIHLPRPRFFISVIDYYETIFHEIGHFLDWQIRRKKEGEFKPDKEKYSFGELIAEIFSCFVMTEFNQAINFDNSIGYIQGWSNALKNDPNMIIKASSHAQKYFDECTGKES